MLNIHCEWKGCSFCCTDNKDVEEHVLSHFKNIYNNSLNVPDKFHCEICDETVPADSSCIRHAYYHAYHFILKGRGQYIIKLTNLSGCNLGVENSNIIPELPQTFKCQWKDCEYKNDSVNDFYNHVNEHPFYEGEFENRYLCHWTGCRFNTVSAFRLSKHVSIHCDKKYIACPNCGLCFASMSKYMDHLKRQIVSVWNKEMEIKELNNVLETISASKTRVIPISKPLIEAPNEAFKCNLCNHLFATKQMLKNHKIRHISLFVCPHCKITAATPYALKRHILFRHTEEKPFQCELCRQAFKSNDILKRHVERVHENGEQYIDIVCQEPNCTFIAKNKAAFNIHRSRMHGKDQPMAIKVFVCHKCNQEYINGSLLTKHLSRDHGVNRTSNRYRHQYKICDDGKYRLNLCDLRLKPAYERLPLTENNDKDHDFTYFEFSELYQKND